MMGLSELLILCVIILILYGPGALVWWFLLWYMTAHQKPK